MLLYYLGSLHRAELSIWAYPGGGVMAEVQRDVAINRILIFFFFYNLRLNYPSSISVLFYLFDPCIKSPVLCSYRSVCISLRCFKHITVCTS